MAVCECKNKENNPPSPSKLADPVLGILPVSTKTKRRRRFRNPLADITNLYNPSSQSSSSSASRHGSQLPPPVSVSAPHSRKRKQAHDPDSTQCTLFKTLRRDFR